jgi:hypothetical protein
MWYGMPPGVSTHSTVKVVLTLVPVLKVRKAGSVEDDNVGKWLLRSMRDDGWLEARL